MAPNVQTPPPADDKASHQFHHFVAPEAWTRSPIMRVLSPPSNRNCSACGSSTSISQILSSPITVDFSSPSNAIQKYINGASDKCFSCTTILGLLRSISNEQKSAEQSGDDASAGELTDTRSGICHIIFNDDLQSRLYQIFVEDTAPPCPINVPRLPILHGPSSSEAIRFIKQQIKTCLKTHSECKDQALDFIPTRLLYITRDGDMHLRFQTDIPARTKYAALSHPWGHERQHPCSTTRDNIDSRKQSIPWDELPQVFHDAVALTLRLGLSYIWIDSLCIVQGDDLDWNRETSDMARIFNGALVTIATHFSQNPYETIFPPHGSLQHKIVTMKQGSKKHDLYARELIPATAGIMHKTDGEFAPLFRRAWPFQECLVSSRIIHVGLCELSFECRACITCECGQHYNSGDSITARHVLARVPATSPIITRFFQKAQPIDDWPSLIEHYSRLELSFEKDRLIALGGYAQQYLQAYPGRQYLAGLWSNDLGRQLLWRNASKTPHRNRDTRCIAPSWSWASAGTEIEYPWKNSHNCLKLSYKVLDSSCRPVDGTPFGAAIGGKFRLKGCLYPARLVVTTILVSNDFSESDSEVVHHTCLECEGFLGGVYFHDVRLDRTLTFTDGSDHRQEPGSHQSSNDDSFSSSGVSVPSGLKSFDIVLLKLFETTEDREGSSRSSVGYMMLREISEPEKLDSHSVLPGSIYERLGIAVASPDGGYTKNSSRDRRPSMNTRRSSFVQGWNKVMSFGERAAGKMDEVFVV